MAHFNPVRFKAFYVKLAVMLLNTLLLFAVLNLMAYFGLKVFYQRMTEKHYKQLREEVISREAYTAEYLTSRRSNAYIDEIVKEHLEASNMGVSYYPMAEYLSPVYRSRLLNIDTVDMLIPYRLGYEDTTKDITPSTRYIFAFGGSTTMGTFVADHDTWPSWLCKMANQKQKERIRVFNFGQPGYSPTQETSLFITLLKLGHRPSAVVFLDGLNTGPITDVSEFSRNMEEGIHRLQTQDGFLSRLASAFPLVVVIQLLRGKDTADLLTDADTIDHPLVGEDVNEVSINFITQRLVQNYRIRQVLGQLYGVPVVQVLQPNSMMGYNPDFMTQAQKDALAKVPNQKIYDAYATVYKNVLAQANYIDLSNLLQQFNKPALTDDIHYSPSFNHYLASHLYEYIDWDSIQPYQCNYQEATGYTFTVSEFE